MNNHIVRPIISDTKNVLVELDEREPARSRIIVTINGYDGVDFTRMSIEDLKILSKDLNTWVKKYGS